MSDTPDKITIRIAIDIPVGVAPAILKSIEPTVAKLTSGIVPTETLAEPDTEPDPDSDEGLLIIARQELNRKQKAFFAKGPLAYRTYRRVRPLCESSQQAYKLVAQEIWLEAPVAAEVLVQKHRKKLRKYIRARNQQTVFRLVSEGQKTKEICEYLGFKAYKVRLLLKEARAAQSGGSNA